MNIDTCILFRNCHPKRCIIDNVVLAYESIDWAIESKQDMVLILLVFKKAYDRMEWSFLEGTMLVLAFSP